VVSPVIEHVSSLSYEQVTSLDDLSLPPGVLAAGYGQTSPDARGHRVFITQPSAGRPRLTRTCLAGSMTPVGNAVRGIVFGIAFSVPLWVTAAVVVAASLGH
jgi:hypothetical protein